MNNFIIGQIIILIIIQVLEKNPKLLNKNYLKKTLEIQEIISQQEVFLSQIIKEYNGNDEKKIIYDKINLKDDSNWEIYYTIYL